MLISLSLSDHLSLLYEHKPNPREILFTDHKQIMYHLPSSCLVLFFLFSLLHLLPYASSTQEGWCESKFQCGSITAGFPFSGGNRSPVCGHPLLQLNCYKDVTSIIISDHLYNVFHINQTSHTLKLARAELQGSFCNSTFTATPTFPSDIFELSPTYKSLTVFFLCDPKLSYRSSYTCPDRGPVTISQNLDYHFGSCKDSFTINVPKSFVPEEKELNLAKLENALREGFELKVKIDEKACQECLSSHGSCSFENTTQVCCKGTSSSRICSSLHQPNATELHTLCSIPFSCGDQTGLSYPFWIYGREDCGHPDFGLNCSGEHAELSISSVKYRILSTNYTSGIIRLTRLDSINDPCPQDPINMSFEENVLPLAQTSDLLTIYYDCNEITESFPTLPTYIKNLDCRNDKTEDDRRDYYVTRSLSSPLPDYSAFLNHFRSFCSKTVSTPASRITLNTLESAASTDNLKKALNESFELGVNKDCKMCMGSGGACGYNQTHTATNGFVCYCIDETTNLVCKRTNKGVSNGGLSAAGKAGIGIASGLGILFITGIGFAFGLGILFITGALLLLIRRRRKTESGQYEKQQNLEALVSLKRYSYTQVKRITNSFAEVIGKGGFGTVYRGTLCDGRSVAVKILKDSKGNGEDFINEVASMSKTSHVNIVDLLGFCSEGSKRAILYEFMENGSLDRLISKKTLEWTKLYSIALGIARGLEYLHHGCKEKIVHFDIKPQNILLDADLCPKVSDFGLAKLCKKKESILSLLDTRGTIGYIAPEVFSKMYGRVSHKSDVYSYGMLVLEMIGARNKERAAQNAGSDTSSMYFPEWIYKDLEKGHNMDGIACEEDEILKKMTLVGLWCIQSSPSDRPPMNRVVEMMESSVDSIETPPRPCVQVPSASFQLSSTLPEDISISSENSRC